MRDYGSKVADLGVARARKKMENVYAQAAKELQRKLLLFRKRFAAKQKLMTQALNNGEISREAYESWLRGQVFTGKRWENKVNQVIGIFSKSNGIIGKAINRIRLWVFGENYNHDAYETEIKTGISFDIYNEDAVQRLINEDPKLLPEWRIDEEKDYTWNRQKVENCINQGIIQGESIDQIADRLARELKSTNMNRMRLFARTAMTGAQNAGRQKQMEDAVARGIKIEKQWLATLDDRTRDTHQHLDGQTVPVDQSFHVGTKNGQESIRYPGDPNAAPALVYNCRCTMKSIFKGINDKPGDRRAYKTENGIRTSYKVKGMTYLEWKKWKEGQSGK